MATKSKFWTSLHGLATLTMIGAALYFLLVEHGATYPAPFFPFDNTDVPADARFYAQGARCQ